MILLQLKKKKGSALSATKTSSNAAFRGFSFNVLSPRLSSIQFSLDLIVKMGLASFIFFNTFL